MSENKALQYNFKQGQTLINLYAENEQEAGELLDAVGRLAGPSAEVGVLLNKAGEAVGLLSTTGGSQSQGAPSASPTVPDRAVPAPSCPHGPRVHKTGGAGNKTWGAWFCDSAKGDPTKCDPLWDEKKR